MPVVTPPRTAETDERSLDERVAELEALIEEARQRARRRRRRGGAVALAAAIAATAAYVSGDGLRAGSVRSADGDAAPAAAFAREPGRWSVATGPPDIWGPKIAIDPTTPTRLYLSAGERVFRSTNGGASWKASRPIAGRIDDLVIDPRRPSVLYAGTGAGVFKSTDAGRSWTPSGLEPTTRRARDHGRIEGRVWEIVIDPADSRVVYAGTYGMYRSTDAGRAWRLLRGAPRGGLAIHPSAPKTLYAVDGGSVWRSRDGGAWRTVLRPNKDISSLAVDPTRAGTVWAVGTAGVFVTRDGGSTWRSPGRAPAVNLDSVTVDPRRPATLYLSTWRKGLFRSIDGGRTWRRFGAGLIDLLAIDPRRATTLYAQDGFGVVKTTDGGRTWTRADAGITASALNAVATAPSNGETVYAGSGSGLSRSDDGGRSWNALRADAVSAIAVDPRNHRHVLVGATGGIIVSRDGGGTWARAKGGAADEVRAIVFDPLDPRRVYAVLMSYSGTTGGPGVVRSTDGGATWQQTSAGIAAVNTIAVDQARPETVYLGGGGGGHVARSVDGGASWGTSDVLGARQVDFLVVDPSDAKTLYAVTNVGLGKTVDGGAHWTRLPNDRRVLGDAYAQGANLVVDPRRGRTLYAATDRAGVLRSSDGGASWQPFGKGLSTLSVEVLAFDATGTTLYAGTHGGGVVSIRVR